MSTIVRRKRTSRCELSQYRRHELLTGDLVYPLLQYYTGYGDGQGRDLCAFISDEMRADWQTHRADLLAFWGSHESDGNFPHALPWLYARGSFDTFPWAAEQFDPDLEATRRELLAVHAIIARPMRKTWRTLNRRPRTAAMPSSIRNITARAPAAIQSAAARRWL